MAETVKLTLRLPPGLHEQIKRNAHELKRSLNAMIVETLRKGLTKEFTYEETKREKSLRVIRECGLVEPLGSEWPNVEDPGITHKELRELLKGVPPLSELIIDDREPR